MKSVIMAACAALAVGAMGVGTNEAVAQCGYGGGFGGYGYSGYSNPRSSFSVGINYNRFPSYRSSSRAFNRGHYDYHPTTVYRHRNHLHVQPGHYDYHHRGHVHHLWR